MQFWQHTEDFPVQNFTDLDQMKKGDIFYPAYSGKNLAYKVDQIRTVLPEETGELDIVEGEDHVTLVTCTPYGVNTHRLLVRGIRTNMQRGKSEMMKPYLTGLL